MGKATTPPNQFQNQPWNHAPLILHPSGKAGTFQAMKAERRLPPAASPIASFGTLWSPDQSGPLRATDNWSSDWDLTDPNPKAPEKPYYANMIGPSSRADKPQYQSPLMKCRSADWAPGGFQQYDQPISSWQYSPDSNASTLMMSPESYYASSIGTPSPVEEHMCHPYSSRRPPPRRAVQAAAILDSFEDPFWYYEVEFKRPGLGAIFTGEPGFQVGDFVMVEADRGKDLGEIVHASADLIKMRKTKTPKKGNEKYKTVLGFASDKELDEQTQLRIAENGCLKFCWEKVQERNLSMDVVDAEFQFDKNKLTFHFKAESRVDFRELVRDMFSAYKTRIWMEHLDGGPGNGLSGGSSAAF